MHPSSLDSVPFASPFPFTRRPDADAPPSSQSAAGEVEAAAVRAKAAVSALRQFVTPSADHYRLVILAQVISSSSPSLPSSVLPSNFFIFHILDTLIQPEAAEEYHSPPSLQAALSRHSLRALPHPQADGCRQERSRPLVPSYPKNIRTPKGKK